MPRKRSYKRIGRTHKTMMQDERGRVRVYIRLINPDDSSVIRGNDTRTLTLDNAKVSEVAEDIERALS